MHLHDAFILVITYFVFPVHWVHGHDKPRVLIYFTDLPGTLVSLMISCWQEYPDSRPSFKEISKYIRATHGKESNLVEAIVQRLESHTKTMEHLVLER